MVFVLYRPVTANGLRKLGGSFFLTLETGDEVTGLAFEFVAFPFKPFAGAPDELPRSGKEADVPVEIDPGEVAAFDSSVLFSPITHPFIRGVDETFLCEFMEGGLVVLES